MLENDKHTDGIASGVRRAVLTRRGLLQAAGLGALAIGAGGLLAACGSDSGNGSATSSPAAAGTTTGAGAATSSAMPAAASSSAGSSASSAAGSSAAGAGAALAKATPFTVASAPGDNYLIDQVCAAQNLFQKYNLVVPKFVYPQSGVQAMQLFATGAINGFQNDTILTMIGYVNSTAGKRPQIVGMRLPETTYSIVVNKGSWPAATASFEDRMHALSGKRVGVTAVGAGADQQLQLALEAAGMKYNDVTHLAVGQFTPGIAQMKANRIDAYVGITYATADLMAAAVGGQVLIPFWDASTPAILSQQQVQPIIAREDYLADHADVIEAWKAAAWDAKDWVVANPDAAAKLLNDGQFAGKGTTQAVNYIKHYTTAVVPKILPDWKVDKAAIDTMIQVAEKLGSIKAGQITYENIVAESARA